MSTVKNLLVPTDFSADAECAINYAKALARTTGAQLHFLHVMKPVEQHVVYGVDTVLPQLDAMREEVRRRAHRSLRELATQAKADGLPAEWQFRTGSVVEEIELAAKELDRAMLVVATHGHSGFDAMVFGSTCEKIIRSTTIPVLVIKHPDRGFSREPGVTLSLKNILVPCDFSECSHAALPFATSLAHRFGARITLLHVVEPHENAELLPELAMSHVGRVEVASSQALDKLGQKMGKVDVRTLVRTGGAAREIRRTIEEEDVDMVVMATHGRAGISHMFFGSVTEKIVRAARCPVLAVHPGSHGFRTSEVEKAAHKEPAHFFG